MADHPLLLEDFPSRIDRRREEADAERDILETALAWHREEDEEKQTDLLVNLAFGCARLRWIRGEEGMSLRSQEAMNNG